MQQNELFKVAARLLTINPTHLWTISTASFCTALWLFLCSMDSAYFDQYGPENYVIVICLVICCVGGWKLSKESKVIGGSFIVLSAPLLLLQVWWCWDNTAHPRHWSEFIDLQERADRAFDGGDYPTAEQLLKTIQEKERSGWFCTHQFNHFTLAASLEEQGKFEEAERVYLQTLRTLEKNPGDGSMLVTCVQNLAIFYWMQSRYGEAEPLFRRALELHRQMDRTWESMLCREDYAQLLRATKREKAAAKLDEEAKTIRAEFVKDISRPRTESTTRP